MFFKSTNAVLRTKTKKGKYKHFTCANLFNYSVTAFRSLNEKCKNNNKRLYNCFHSEINQ